MKKSVNYESSFTKDSPEEAKKLIQDVAYTYPEMKVVSSEVFEKTPGKYAIRIHFEEKDS